MISASGASTLYQATGHPEFFAKSRASVVLPVPARPLIIVELQELRLLSNNALSLTLEPEHVSAGIDIFSSMRLGWPTMDLCDDSIKNIALMDPRFVELPTDFHPRFSATSALNPP